MGKSVRGQIHQTCSFYDFLFWKYGHEWGTEMAGQMNGAIS